MNPYRSLITTCRRTIRNPSGTRKNTKFYRESNHKYARAEIFNLAADVIPLHTPMSDDRSSTSGCGRIWIQCGLKKWSIIFLTIMLIRPVLTRCDHYRDDRHTLEQKQQLLVGLKARELDNSGRKPSNLVFLIDVSGSMDSPDKLQLVKRSFHLLTENLTENDRISIVIYASSDKIICNGVSGEDKAKIIRYIEDLEAGGATFASQGINTAYQLAQENFIPNGNNRIILATDGDFNIGVTSDGDLKRLVEENRKLGISVTTLGFGCGNLKDSKLEILADHGNGSYHYIDSILEARKVLVEEIGSTLEMVAKDVKLQLEFNPQQVMAIARSDMKPGS